MIQKILACLGMSLLVGCKTFNPNAATTADLGQNATAAAFTFVPRPLPGEPQLSGIPLSCYTAYLQSIPAKDPNANLSAEQEDLVEARHKRAADIVTAYLDAGWDSQALQFARLEPGKLWWIAIKRYAEQGQIKKAVQLAEAFEAGRPRSDVEWRLISLYKIAKQPEQALKLLNARTPEDSVALSMVEISGLYAQQGKITKANQLVDRALQMVASYSSEYRNRVLSAAVESYAEAGQSGKALQFAEQIRAENSHFGRLLLNIVRSNLSNGQTQSALALLDQLQVLNQKLVYRQLQIKNQSLPHHAIFSLDLAGDTAIAYAEAGELQQSLELMDTVVDAYQNSEKRSYSPNGFRWWKAEVLLQIAEQFRKTGRTAERNQSLALAIETANTLHDGQKK